MQKLKVTTVINCDIKKVWQHWNSVESITGWAFASNDWECPFAENDLKVGGRFLTRMQAKDKSVSFDFAGTYTEVVELYKIKYKMDKLEDEQNNRECKITFTTLGENITQVDEESDPENLNSLEMQQAGWQAILENFKKFVEAN